MKLCLSAEILIQEGINDFYDNTPILNNYEVEDTLFGFEQPQKPPVKAFLPRNSKLLRTKNIRFPVKRIWVGEIIRFEKFITAHNIKWDFKAVTTIRYLLHNDIKVRQYIKNLKSVYGVVRKEIPSMIHYGSYIKYWVHRPRTFHFRPHFYPNPTTTIYYREEVIEWGERYAIRKKLRMGTSHLKFTTINTICEYEKQGHSITPYYYKTLKFLQSTMGMGDLTQYLTFPDLHSQLYIISIIRAFGPKTMDWLKHMKSQNIDLQMMDLSDIEDKIYLDQEKLDWLFSIQFNRNSTRILKSWTILKSLGWDPNNKNSQLIANQILAENKYNNVRIKEISTLSAQLGYNQYDFEKFQEFWELRDIPTYLTVPPPGGIAGIIMGDLRIYQLDKNDYRAPVIGSIVKCCQYLTGLGASCARHSVESPDGAVWVVERFGSILAQSWVWRAKQDEYLVIDNIEAERLSGDLREKVKQIYLLAIESVKGRLGISRVIIGRGYTKINFDSIAESSRENDDLQEITRWLPEGYSGYSDLAVGCWRI